jgi:threonine aldolase
VYFLVGGTQTNTTVIDGVLDHHEGVLAAESGHINVHESGAIEATGHKVLTLPSYDGKVKADDVRSFISNFYSDDTYEHMVAPGMLYISFPTEYGTIYSLKELEDLSDACHDAGIPLFIDGARLGYGLEAEGNDVSLSDIARLSDIFYIGGTKVGALFGEAVVITNEALKKDFRYSIKQHGGMLAKGRLLGIQFATLFTDNLYMNISRHAIDEALRIKAALQAKGIPFLIDSSTNQQFPIFNNEQLASLSTEYLFSIWQVVDKQHTAVRICTSWATQTKNVDQLIAAIEQL